MARYDAEHKTQTRQRIIDSAGRRLKQDGIDGSGVAGLMADAGLTNGAFYAHFASKDDLVAHVIAEQLAAQCAVLTGLPENRPALDQFVREYLSPQHRDHPETGCPNAALLEEISRCGDAIRDAYTQGVEAVVHEIAVRLSAQNPAAARSRALGLFTVLVATLQLARAVNDEELSDEVLRSGIETVELLLNTEHSDSVSTATKGKVR